MAVVMVVSMVGMASVAVAQDTGEQEAQTDIEPGERLSGIVGVTDAELDGEIAERGFGISVAQAATEDAQAAIVAERLADIEQRLADLAERKAALDEALEAGEISQGKYMADVAKVEVERMTAERLAEQSGAVAAELPADVLEANGINVEAIEELRQNASALTGPEVADIARTIAGPNVGERLPDAAGDRIPVDPGQPGDGDGDEQTDENGDA